jgi:hypothetical protein
MNFCSKCRYAYNVTRNIKDKQSGGKISDAIDSLLEKFHSNQKIEKEDLESLTGEDILDNEKFESMTKKDQKKLMTMIKSIDKKFFDTSDEEPSTNTAYFICKFCKHTKEIKPGTVIYSRVYNGVEVSSLENKYAIYDDTLPRTKNYFCKNKNCQTYEDPSIKEAVMDRNALYQIVYICTICQTQWTNEI